MEKIIFKKGVMVKVDGIPFWLKEDTTFIGELNNASLIRNHKSLGEPSAFRVTQSETSEMTNPSSLST